MSLRETSAWRPRTLEEYVGQEDLVRQLKDEIAAAKHGDHAPPNILLTGPPGLGKSTLFDLFAKELSPLPGMYIMGPSATDLELTEKLGKMNRDGYERNTGRIVDKRIIKVQAIGIDECEEMKKTLFENIHSAMEPDANGLRTFQAKIPGKSQRVRIFLPECCFVLMTNYLGRLRKRAEAAVNRCEIQWEFKPYSIDELSFILRQYAKVMQTSIADNAIGFIASRSLGTPRTARHLFNRARARMIAEKRSRIDESLATAVIKFLRIDDRGLNSMAQGYLTVLGENPQGKMSLATLAARLGIDQETITDVERFLLRQNLARITGTGRQITDVGLEHVGLAGANSIHSSILH